MSTCDHSFEADETDSTSDALETLNTAYCLRELLSMGVAHDGWFVVRKTLMLPDDDEDTGPSGESVYITDSVNYALGHHLQPQSWFLCRRETYDEAWRAAYSRGPIHKLTIYRKCAPSRLVTVFNIEEIGGNLEFDFSSVYAL